MTSAMLYGALTLGVCALLACRIDKMNRGITDPIVFLQHFQLGVAAVVAWWLGYTEYSQWADVVLLGSVLVFFLFSMPRWRDGAPPDTGTSSGAELDILREMTHDEQLRVVGGRGP